MKNDIFWTSERYPGRIALVSRPRGGDWLETEAESWAVGGLNVIVSMLERSEIEEFDLGHEGEVCLANNIEFILLPVPDRGVPTINPQFLKLIEKLREALMKGANIGIHCRQSIGRAPLLAAVLMTSFGMEISDAFGQVGVARGRAVPETDEQMEWVNKFADRYLLIPAG